MPKIELDPIGIIHSPFRNRSQAPFQGILSDEECELEIYEEFADGLKDIEGFSHIIIVYYAHKSNKHHLKTTTPWDTQLHGIFTTCSPNRPNHLLISVVPLLNRIGDRRLKVTNLDAIDGTPIMDIKPYIPYLVIRENVRIGWFEKVETPLKREKK